MENLVTVGIIVVGIIVAILLLGSVLTTMWKKVPKDKAAVITGGKKPKVITGGGGWMIPFIHRIDFISLGNITLDVDSNDILSNQGVPISVCTTAVIKVKNDESSILTAIEQFTGRNETEIADSIKNQAISVLEGKLREIVAGMTVEDLYNNREQFRSEVEKVVSEEFAGMGLEIKNFTIKSISDDNGYIDAMGAGRIAEQKKDAEIRKSEAKREQDEKTSENIRLGEQAKIKAETEINEAQKNKEVRQAEFNEEQSKAQAKAALAQEIQTNISQKEVIQAQADAQLLQEQRNKEIAEAKIQVEITQAAKNTELAEQQAKEQEKRLQSSVVIPAKADREKQEQEAEAEKFNSIKKAEADAEKKKIDAIAEAEAIKAKALADADAIRAKAEAEANATTLTGKASAEAISAKGTAEAEATRAKLLAEAEGLKAKKLAEAEGTEKLAEAMQKMNQAGVTQMIIDKLPEIAGAIAKPMEQIDKISIIGGGNGDGVNEVSDYVPTVLAKTIESVKETTGFDLVDVMKANTIQAKTDKNINGAVETSDGKEVKVAPKRKTTNK